MANNILSYKGKQIGNSIKEDNCEKIINEIFETSKVKFRCLSGQYKSAEHPFIYCGLGEFFDHLKGPERKSQGFSKERLDKEICVV